MGAAWIKGRMAVILAVAAVLLAQAIPVLAVPAAPDPGAGTGPERVTTAAGDPKVVDLPGPARTPRSRTGGPGRLPAAVAAVGRPLVILVEFAGTDTFSWTRNTSTWDPLGDPDASEYTYTPGDCSLIAAKLGITDDTPRNFTYSGPLHNAIERPRSASDASGKSIWTENFAASWYQDVLFGNGVVFDYSRGDGSTVNLDFSGKSLSSYLQTMSGGSESVQGDVVGWIQLPHSIWWYGADQCPGRLSGGGGDGGYIPGAGSRSTLVQDAVLAVQAIVPSIPGFDWANYDQDGDGVIDQLWIIHAGRGEEAPATLLRTWDDPATPADDRRSTYGESSLWSGASAMVSWTIPGTAYSVGPYLLLPEDVGLSALAHEYGHRLGGQDLFGTLGSSVGFWSPLGDPWSGYPTGFLPAAYDPLMLDQAGWLAPLDVSDPGVSYEVTLGQAGSAPADPSHQRAVRIPLPDGIIPLPIPPVGGSYYWFGGQKDLANGMMTLAAPLALPPAAEASLSFSLVWDIETEWDFLWVQVSTDDTTWTTLTNGDTVCTHVAGWIGSQYGFPDDLCAAGIGGFTGYNPEWPAWRTETFDLSAWAGQSVRIRFWYMTDWGTLYTGPYLDNVVVSSGGSPIFSDDAEAGGGNWTYVEPWVHSDGNDYFSQSYYLQWRNTGANGGYDTALGDARGAYGPAESGLLVWYRNEFYADNEVFNHLLDYPGFGPKGRLLLVDAHPQPYRDPYWVAYGYANEGANIDSRLQMRDAPFSLSAGTAFTLAAEDGFVHDTNEFAGRPAVTSFNDALGYYPGGEYVSRGPSYSPPSWKWVSVDWDASAVMPSSVFYGIKAPGYVGAGAGQQEFRWRCSRTTTGHLSCYWLGTGTGLGYDGGDGNPGSVGGDYGWKVEVVEEAGDRSWGKVLLTGPPVALNQSIRVAKDTATPVTLMVRDPGTGMTSWRVLTQPEHGTLSGTAPDLTYTPAAGYLGDDGFTFQAGYAGGITNKATVTLSVQDAYSIKGRVTTNLGMPLRRVKIWVTPEGGTPVVVRTKARGRYEFKTGFSGVSYTLRPGKVGLVFRPRKRVVLVESAPVVKQNFRAWPR